MPDPGSWPGSWLVIQPAKPTFTFSAFLQMAALLSRLEAAYLAAQEAGVQKGRLEGQEGDAKGAVTWPYGYDKTPAVLHVSIEARVPAPPEEEG